MFFPVLLSWGIWLNTAPSEERFHPPALMGRHALLTAILKVLIIIFSFELTFSHSLLYQKPFPFILCQLRTCENMTPPPPPALLAREALRFVKPGTSWCQTHKATLCRSGNDEKWGYYSAFVSQSPWLLMCESKLAPGALQMWLMISKSYSYSFLSFWLVGWQLISKW